MAKKRTLYRSTLAVIVLLLLSKVLGFVRQAAIAGIFGSDAATDLYFVSSDFITTISGAITQALVTALVTAYVLVKTRDGEQAAKKLASRAMLFFELIAVLLTGLVIALARPLARVLAPGYEGAQLDGLAVYLRLFAAVLALTIAQANYTAVLNAEGIFTPGKLYGVLFNVFAVAAVLLLGRKFGISVLVWATYAAQVLQLVILVLCCGRLYRVRPGGLSSDPELTKLVRSTMLLLLCNVVMQLNTIAGKAVCSFLAEGTATIYAYAHSIEQLVTGTFIAAVSLTLLPRMADSAAREDRAALSALLRRVLSVGLELLIYVAMVTVLMSRQIVALVYQRGAFTEDHVGLTALALCGFALGFPLVAYRELLRQIHFAFQRSERIIWIDVAALVFCVGLAFAGAKTLGVFGVCAAVSAAALFGCLLLGRSAARYLGLRAYNPTWQESGKALICLALSAAALWGSGLLVQGTIPRLVLGVVCSGLAYAAANLLLRTACAAELRRLLHRE